MITDKKSKENNDSFPAKGLNAVQEIASGNLELEKLKLKFQILKWILIAIATVFTFWVIDVGKLNIEKFKAHTRHEEKLLDAYILATKSSDPEEWKRKLNLLSHFSKDSSIIKWTQKEKVYIYEKAPLLTVYKETVRVCSIVANRQLYASDEWNNALKRYYQLYWADLPFYGETQNIIEVMISFKSELDKIESKEDIEQWKNLDYALIELSEVFKEEYIKLQNSN
jgi:hypothetical protein